MRIYIYIYIIYLDDDDDDSNTSNNNNDGDNNHNDDNNDNNRLSQLDTSHILILHTHTLTKFLICFLDPAIYREIKYYSQ